MTKVERVERVKSLEIAQIQLTEKICQLQDRINQSSNYEANKMRYQGIKELSAKLNEVSKELEMLSK